MCPYQLVLQVLELWASSPTLGHGLILYFTLISVGIFPLFNEEGDFTVSVLQSVYIFLQKLQSPGKDCSTKWQWERGHMYHAMSCGSVGMRCCYEIKLLRRLSVSNLHPAPSASSLLQEIFPGNIMEQILLNAIMQHLQDNQDIRPRQHGFVKDRSCFTNMVSFFKQVTCLVGEGMVVNVVSGL